MIELNVLTKSVSQEATIPLKSEAPADVIREYEKNHKGKLVIWKSIEKDECGCIQNNRSVNTSLSNAARVVVFEIKPAKGSGWVGMTLQDDSGKELVTLFISRYTQLSINWLNRTQVKVSEFLGLQSEFQDFGYDV